MKKLLSVLMIGIMVLSLTGCGEYVPPEKSSYEVSAETNEKMVRDIIKSDTLPKITRSLERENVKRRVEFINQPDRVGYLYLLSDNGQLIREVQVLGKVSSLNSYLTPMEEIHTFEGYIGGSGRTEEPVVLSASDLDGTYGENQDGIFWFTADGVYQEWSGMYFYSSERMTFTTQPLLVEEVK